jgi:Ca-activated chloride channel family protein
MQFLWPQFLWLLLALPLLVLLYVWLLRRKKKLAVRYASLSIVRRPWARPEVRRHIPPALFLLAMAAMLLAAARPMAVVTLPSNQQTIILAMDVSGSMRATDVSPTGWWPRRTRPRPSSRSCRAREGGHRRLRRLAQVAQLPTLNREDLVTAIDRFQLQRATATGNAIVVSLATLFPDAGIDLTTMQPMAANRQRGFAIDGEKKERRTSRRWRPARTPRPRSSC